MPRFRKIFSEFGLTEQQWRVLRVLWERDEIPFRELSDLTLISSPSLVGVVDRLDKAGYVRRRRSDVDRRNVFVLATESGHELEQLVMPRIQQTYVDLKTSVHPDIWESLLQALEKISSLPDEGTDSVAVQKS